MRFETIPAHVHTNRTGWVRDFQEIETPRLRKLIKVRDCHSNQGIPNRYFSRYRVSYKPPRSFWYYDANIARHECHACCLLPAEEAEIMLGNMSDICTERAASSSHMRGSLLFWRRSDIGRTSKRRVRRKIEIFIRVSSISTQISISPIPLGRRIDVNSTNHFSPGTWFMNDVCEQFPVRWRRFSWKHEFFSGLEGCCNHFVMFDQDKKKWKKKPFKVWKVYT